MSEKTVGQVMLLVPAQLDEDMAAAMECEFSTEGQYAALLAARPSYCKDSDALIAAAPTMLEALKEAAARFREYEAIHAAKGNLDGDVKARSNALMAEKLEAAIALAESSPLLPAEGA